MNRSHQSFLQQNGSTLLEKEAEICGFKTYQFRSSNGYGKTSIFELGSRATISFSDHLYYNDFEYAVLSEDSVVIHQYQTNGYNIVLDVHSGSVHVVEPLA